MAIRQGNGLRFELTERTTQPSLEDVLRRLTDGGRLMLRVGLFEGANPTEDGLSTAAYMSFHEFGTSTIPERPWFRSAIQRNRAAYVRMMVGFAKQIVAGSKTPEQALTELGVRVKGDLQRSITEFGLIDTGTARNSVAFEVKAKE